jgi:hypothetical protein
MTTAATRRLFPAPEAAAILSPEDQQRVAAHRTLASRKLKAAQALLAAGLPEEAAPPACETLHALGCALALERRLPAPPDADACARPPWVGLFPRAVPTRAPTTNGDGAADPSSLIALLAEAMAAGPRPA